MFLFCFLNTGSGLELSVDQASLELTDSLLDLRLYCWVGAKEVHHHALLFLIYLDKVSGISGSSWILPRIDL